MATKTKIQEVVDFFQPRLGLKDWIIEIEIVTLDTIKKMLPDYNDLDNLYTLIFIFDNYRLARLLVIDNVDYEIATAASLDTLIVHELLHIHFKSLERLTALISSNTTNPELQAIFYNKIFRDNLENVIDQLARVIVEINHKEFLFNNLKNNTLKNSGAKEKNSCISSAPFVLTDNVAQSVLNKYQHLLHLTDWDIFINLEPSQKKMQKMFDTTDIVNALIKIDPINQNAQIYLWTKYFKAKDEVIMPIDVLIVHELLHIHFKFLFDIIDFLVDNCSLDRNLINRLVNMEKEKIISVLSKAIVKMHTKQNSIEPS